MKLTALAEATTMPKLFDQSMVSTTDGSGTQNSNFLPIAALDSQNPKLCWTTFEDSHITSSAPHY